MSNPIKIIVRDYSWIHLSLGLTGNTLFFLGSVFFLPLFEHVARPEWLDMKWQTFAVWLFIVGSFLMLVGALGNLLVDLWKE